MARGALWQGEFKNRKKDGTVFYSHARITTVEGTTERLYVTVQEDITERRAARLALERSERRLAEAHRLAHIGAWERDLRTGTGWWSEELYRIFEAPRDEPRVFDTFLSARPPGGSSSSRRGGGGPDGDDCGVVGGRFSASSDPTARSVTCTAWQR